MPSPLIIALLPTLSLLLMLLPVNAAASSTTATNSRSLSHSDEPSSSQSASPSPPFSTTPTVSPSLQASLTTTPSWSTSSTLSQEFTWTNSHNVSVTVPSSSPSINSFSGMQTTTDTESITYTRTMSLTISKSFSPTMGSITVHIVTPTLTWRGMTETTSNSLTWPSMSRVDSPSPSRTETGVMTLTPSRSDTPSVESSASLSKSQSKTQSPSPSQSTSPSSTPTPSESQQGTWSSTTSPTAQLTNTPSTSRSIGSGSPSDVESRSASKSFSISNTTSVSQPTPSEDITHGTKSLSISSTDAVSASRTVSLPDANTSTIAARSPSASATDVHSFSDSATGSRNLSVTRHSASPTTSKTLNSVTDEPTVEKTSTPTASHSDISASLEASRSDSMTDSITAWSATPNDTLTVSLSGGSASPTDVRTPSPSTSDSSPPSLSDTPSTSSSHSSSETPTTSGTGTQAASNSETISDGPDSRSRSTSYSSSLSASANVSSPSDSASSTPTSTYNIALSVTPVPSASRLSPSASQSLVPTPTPDVLATDTTTHTFSMSASRTSAASPTASASPTVGTLSPNTTDSRSAPSPTSTPSSTDEVSPSESTTLSRSPSVSASSAESATDSLSKTPQSQSEETTPSASWSLTPTETPGVTASLQPNATSTATFSSVASASASPTEVRTQSRSSSASVSDDPRSLSPSVTVSLLPLETPSVSLSPSQTGTPSMEVTATPSRSDSGTKTFTLTPSESVSSPRTNSLESLTGTPSPTTTLSPSRTQHSQSEALSSTPTPSSSPTAVTATPVFTASETLSADGGTLSPTQSTTLSSTLVQTITKRSSTDTESHSASEEGSTSPTSSRSRPTPSQTSSLTPTATDEPSTTQSSSAPRSMTVSIELVRSNSGLISATRSAPSPSGSTTLAGSMSFTNRSMVGSFSLSHSASDTPTPTDADTQSKSLSPPSGSWEPSKSLSLLETETPTFVPTPTPSLESTSTQESDSISPSASPSGTSAASKSRSAGTPAASASATASYLIASFTSTRTLVHTPSPTATDSISYMETASTSESVSPSDEGSSKSNTTSPTDTISASHTSSPSEEPSSTASVLPLDTQTETLHMTESASEAGSATMSGSATLTRTVTLSEVASMTTTPSVTEVLTPSPTSSATLGPHTATDLPTVTRRRASRSKSAPMTFSTSVRDSASVMPAETASVLLTLSQQTSTSKSDASPSTSPSEVDSSTPSISPSPSADPASSSGSASYTQTISPLVTATLVLPITATTGVSRTHSASEDGISASRSASEAMTTSESDTQTISFVQSATEALPPSASESSALSASSSVSEGFDSSSRSVSRLRGTLSPRLSHSRSTTAGSVSDGGSASTTPSGTATPTTEFSPSESQTETNFRSVTETIKETLTVGRLPTPSVDPSLSESLSNVFSVSRTMHSPSSSATSLTYSTTFSQQASSKSTTVTGTFTQTFVSTPTILVSTTTTATLSLPVSTTISRNTRSSMHSMTTTVSNSVSQEDASKTMSDSSSESEAMTYTINTTSRSWSYSMTMSATTTVSLSSVASASVSLLPTKTLTITPPPTPSHSFSGQSSFTPSGSSSQSFTIVESDTVRLSYTQSRSVTPTSSRTTSRESSSTDSSDPSATVSRSTSAESISSEDSCTTTFSRDISASTTVNDSMTTTLVQTPTTTLKDSGTATHVPSLTDSGSETITSMMTDTASLNITESLTLSLTDDASSTHTLRGTDSPSLSPSVSKDYISPNTTFTTAPYSASYEYTANRFLAVRLQGVPLNVTGDRMMLVKLYDSCSAPLNGNVTFRQSARPSTPLLPHNWTAVPRLSGVFMICYYTTTSGLWHKIVYPVSTIRIYAAASAQYTLQVVNNTAVLSQYSLIMFGANTSADKPFLIPYGRTCTGPATTVAGNVFAFNNVSYLTTIQFLNIPAAGDYSVCYMGYPHLLSKALLVSGTRRMRIIGAVSSTVVGATMVGQFKVGRTVSIAVSGVGLSVRDAFFLTNASLDAAAPPPCSMPYNIPGSVRVSWGQVDRVTTSDTVPSAFNLLAYSVSFRLSVPYNLSMCYRSNFSSTFALIGPLEYAVEPILPTWRAPNVSSSSLRSPTVWSLGGSLFQTFSGEGVSNVYDAAFLVINGTSCRNTSGSLRVVDMSPLSTLSTTAFAILTLPTAAALVASSSSIDIHGLAATVCYRSNFSAPLNMGQVLLTSTFWNATDPSTQTLFAVGMRMAFNASVAIASEAVTPGTASSNILYLLEGINAQCAAVAPLDATYANARNRTHATFYVPNRGVYQLCVVSATTSIVQNASFASMPRDPTAITPTATIGILQPTRIFIDGGVDFIATATPPDVLYPCNASLADVVVVVPSTSNSVFVTSKILSVVAMCVRYGVQPSVTASVGNITIVPQIHSIQTMPLDHRVGTTITIVATGFGLTQNDSLYPCDVGADVLAIQLSNFTCGTSSSGGSESVADAAPCTSTWSAAASGAGSFVLCYRYARNVSFPAGAIANLTTGANISVAFDASVQSLTPSHILASIESFVNITGSGMALGVSALFLRTTSGSVCEATPVNPSDALYFTKVNSSSSSGGSASGDVDASISWSLWTIANTASARGMLPVCYVSFSGATYTAGTLDVKSIVTNFSTTQQFVSSTLRYAGVEIDVVVVGAAMLASADTLFMAPASSSSSSLAGACAASTGNRSMLYGANQPSGLQTTLSYRVIVPTEGSYTLCYHRNSSDVDVVAVAGNTLVVSSSFLVTATNITLVGPAPFLAPSFRFSFATNLTGAFLTPYRSASSASSISVLYMPVGTTLLSADMIGVNGLTILTINQTIAFPIANTTICTNFPQSLLQSDARYQFAMSFIALYNFDLTYCYDRIPSNYVLSPSLLITEVLSLTESDVALIQDTRTTMSVITRVSLKIPQTASRTTALMTTLLANTEQSLNIPDSDITEELLLAHGDIVAEIFSAAAEATTTFDRGTVLKAVNRLNVVGAKYCSSGITGSSTAKEVIEDAYSFSTQNLLVGTSQVTVRVTTRNAATSSTNPIQTTAHLANQNSLAGCFMSLAAPSNFIPGQSTASTNSRTFQAQDIASSVADAFNAPLLSVSLPASTLSDPLAAFDQILFVVPHEGIADSNLTLGVGIEYAFYRFSPTFSGATTGEWVSDPAATAVADNRTINITYDLSKSGATSSSNPQSYFFLSGRYRVFANTEPLVTRSRDDHLIMYVGALVVAHLIFVVVGMLADRRIDRRKENPHAPTAAVSLFSTHPSSVLPTAYYNRRASAVVEHAPHTDGEDVTPFGGHYVSLEGTPTAAGGDGGDEDAAITVRTDPHEGSSTRASPSYRHPPTTLPRRASVAMPHASLSALRSAHPSRRASSFVVQPDAMSPSHQPIDDGQSPTSGSIRGNTRWSLHRLMTIFVRQPFHPVGVPARVTSFATFVFAVSIFSQVVLEEVVHEHAVAWNVLYGLCAAVMSTPFATPSRIGLLLLTKDVPSMAASVGGIVCVAAALFQSTVYVGAIACAVGGVVLVPLVWLVWYRRSSLDTQPRLSRTPLVAGLVAHGIVEAAAVAYLLYRALGEGTPTAWRRHQDYYITVGFALAFDLCLLEPLKNHLTLFASVIAGVREMRYNERAMIKKANKEAKAREAAEAKARQEELEAQAQQRQHEEEAAAHQEEEDMTEEKQEPFEASEYRGHETDTEFERSEERALRKRHLPLSHHPRPPTQLDRQRRHSGAPDSSSSYGRNFLEEEELDFDGKAFFEDVEEDEDPFEVPQRRQLSGIAPFDYDDVHGGAAMPQPLEEVDVATTLAGSEFTSVLSEGHSSEEESAEEPRDRAPAPANSRPSMRFDVSSSDSDRPQRRSSRLSRISIVSALDDNWESFRSDDDEAVAVGEDHRSVPFDPEAFDGVTFDDEGDNDIVTDDGALSEIEVDYLDNNSTR